MKTDTTDARTRAPRERSPFLPVGTPGHDEDEALKACIRAGGPALRALALERLGAVSLRVPADGFYVVRAALALLESGEPSSAVLTLETWWTATELPDALDVAIDRAMMPMCLLAERGGS